MALDGGFTATNYQVQNLQYSESSNKLQHATVGEGRTGTVFPCPGDGIGCLVDPALFDSVALLVPDTPILVPNISARRKTSESNERMSKASEFPKWHYYRFRNGPLTCATHSLFATFLSAPNFAILVDGVMVGSKSETSGGNLRDASSSSSSSLLPVVNLPLAPIFCDTSRIIYTTLTSCEFHPKSS